MTIIYEAMAHVELAGAGGRPGRDRGAVALGCLRVRKLCEAQQEDLARGRRCREPDRGLFEAGRYGRVPSVDQDHREAGDALETVSASRCGLEKALGFMEGEISVLQVEKRIRSRVKRQMEKTQREYYLNEQMKAIQKELGDGEDGRDEMAEMEEKHRQDQAVQGSPREGGRRVEEAASQMSPMSAEATVVRNYLDWLLGLPWNKKSRVKIDLNAAEKVLDEDHFGLEKVKERIVEYLAVQARSSKIKGPILCLVGPPGVGKTSLAKSIAKATGREYVRMALGGVRDEAEIRGHRRTYIGSMPGKVIQSMKKAKKTNPLFLLDEIDKMGQDFRGDPSSALLEVLDPEQNSTFMDHYLEVEYDLSNVMFITTANTLNIPAPLMDRMEVIRIAGYTEDEKQQIARRHLLPQGRARPRAQARRNSRSPTRRCCRLSGPIPARPVYVTSSAN